MAPRPDLLRANARALARLEDIPPFMRDDPDVQAIIYCQSKEDDRVEETIEDVRAQLRVSTATATGLPWWEALLRVAVAPDADVDVRRQEAVARLQALTGDPSGRSWESRLAKRIGTNWTYEEHIPGDATSPPAQVLRFHLPGGTSLFSDQLIIREEVPAELDVVFVSAGGFVLDESHLDTDAL